MESCNFQKHLYALIICGGGGTRLWPCSRNKTPKQFLKIFGKLTLFQKTVRRLKNLVSPENIIVVTVSKNYSQEIKKEAPKIPPQNIFWEPMRRNTAIACGLGTLIAQIRDPKAIVMNFWADHLIEKENIFKKVELIAVKTAFEKQTIIAIGVKPTQIHTGFGYIHAKKIIKKVDGIPIYKLEKFVEKPDYETAKKFLESGEYYWNSGMYVWPANFFLEALKKYSSATYLALEKIRKALGTSQERRIIKKAYQQAPEISVDSAVSEKVKGALMIPAKIGWRDIGDWRAIYDIFPKNKEGNVILKPKGRGKFIGINTKNSLIHLENRLIALIGVEDFFVIDTRDAILICKKEFTQDVKKLVEFLKEKKEIKYL